MMYSIKFKLVGIMYVVVPAGCRYSPTAMGMEE